MKTLENSLGEVNVRLTDDERQVADLQSAKAKAQKELESLTTQLEEAESKSSTLERQNKSLNLQVQEVQVSLWRKYFSNEKCLVSLVGKILSSKNFFPHF